MQRSKHAQIVGYTVEDVRLWNCRDGNHYHESTFHHLLPMSRNPYSSCLLTPNTPEDIQLHYVTGKNWICNTASQQLLHPCGEFLGRGRGPLCHTKQIAASELDCHKKSKPSNDRQGIRWKDGRERVIWDGRTILWVGFCLGFEE